MVHAPSLLFYLAHVKRKCKTRIEIVGAGSPRPQSVRVGGPNPYEDSVAVARFLNMNLLFQEFIIVDLRITETLQPFSRLVGTVSNCADAVRLETAPTGGRKCLFIFRIHYN